ncbi:MAG TPA: FG-GAP-like repeat-containing protein [Candidatus Polarisedimenticolaceae bacterium]|nr:FG-GAP-like repeat-containing protein [Candidatus Polarisedimenticolaceae bacterium]
MSLSVRLLAAAGLALLSTSSRTASIVPLGCPDLDCATTPPPNSGFIAVGTGNYHTMGLRADGSIVAWGMCDVGQCAVPLPNSGFRAISAGDSHSLAMRGDGSIAAWGSNENAQLDVPLPNTGYVAMAAGLLHNLALRPGGFIVGWGYTPWGDLLPPASVPNSDWVAIAAGGYYSMGLKADGSIYKWGCNGLCPTPVPNTGFTAISTHFEHSLAVRAADGSIAAWGSNTYGQLDVPSPNQGFVAVAAGDHFSVGLKSDGTVRAWGGGFDRDSVALPNRGYLAISANRGLSDLLRSEMNDAVFSEAPLISRGGAKAYVVVGDVDADGDQDLVAADYADESVAWYENDGGAPPHWTKRVVDGFAMGPQQVAAGDLDGDGDLDILSTNFNEDGVFWYQNNGATWTKQFLSTMAGWGVHVADVDGDGDLDGIAGDRWDNTPEHKGVEWYDNDGGSPPTFTVRRVSAGFVEATSVHAADVDGDGDTDILAVDVFQDSVYWFESSGAHPPAWTQRTLTTATDDPFAVFPADLDDDGDVDVLTASSEDDTIAWYENNGARPPVWTRRVITNQAPRAIVVFAIDLDGDGDMDVASGASGDEIAWYESNGAATPSFTRHVLSHRCGGPASIFAARLDPDADVDLVAGCDVAAEIHWFPSWAAQAESDGDGVPDALDCAPNDPTAYAIPGLVRDVHYETKTALFWSAPEPAAGSGTVYDVLRGSLQGFPVGSGTGEVCLAGGTGATFVSDGTVPPAGTGRYYVVRAKNACGDGSYGARSSGAERTSPTCP